MRTFYDPAAEGGPFSPARAAGALSFMRNIANVHPEIAGMLLVNERDMYLSNEIAPITRDPLLDEEWYHKASGNPTTATRSFSNAIRSYAPRTPGRIAASRARSRIRPGTFVNS